MTEPRFPRRRWRWIAIGVGVAVLAAPVLIWTLRLPLANWALDRAKTEIPGLDATVTAVNATGVSIEGLNLRDDHGLTVDRIDLDFSPLEVLSGRIERVSVFGARLDGTWDGHAVDLGPLDRLLAPGDPGSGGGVPDIGTVELRDLRARLGTPEGPATLTADGHLSLDGSEDSRFELVGGLGPGRLEGAVVASGGPGARRGTISLRASDFRLPGLAEAVAGQLDAEVAFQDTGLSLVLKEDSSAQIGRVQPALFAALGLPEGTATDLSVTVGGTARRDDGALVADLKLHGGVAALSLAGTDILDGALSARVSARLDGGDWSLDLTEGTVATSTPALSADRIGARLEGPAAGPMRVTLTDARLNDGQGPPRFSELALTGEAEIAPAAIRFTGAARMAFGKLVLEVQGDHDPATGGGRAAVTLHPIRFQPGLFHPAALFPAATVGMHDVEGGIEAAGPVTWGPEGLASDLSLLARDLSLSFGDLTVRRLNAAVVISRPWPVETPPGQLVGAAVLDAGIPFTDAMLRFHLRRDLSLDIQEARLRFAKGTVSVRDERIDLANAKARFDLRVEDVDLTTLLGLAQLDGLRATGTLDGRIPLRLDGAEFVISEGRIATGAPGVLAYDPSRPPAGLAGGADILLKALTNFHYQSLAVTLDRDVGGETLLTLGLKGNNPDFYGGHPVELNVNVEGKLDQIVFQSLEGYRIPNELARRMGLPGR